MTGYQETFRTSIDDPERFWGHEHGAAGAIDWHRPPTRALDDSRPPFYRWFPDGELNTCHNALDRHVEAGHGQRTALVYDSPVTARSAATATPRCATRWPGSPACSAGSGCSRATGW